MTAFAELFSLMRNGLSVRQNSDSGGLPITRIETISDGRVDPSRVGYAGLDSAAASKWLLQPGDLLFSHINSPQHVGKTALYDGSPAALVHGMNLLCLRPKVGLAEPRWVLHLTRSSFFRFRIQQFVNRAVNQASISIRNLSSVQVEVPQLDEQRRIATILDHADALRAKRREVLGQLGSLAHSIFNETFGAPSSWPRRWAMGTIGDMAESVQYGTAAKAGDNGKWPIIRMGNLTDEGRLDLSDLKWIDLTDSDIPKFTVQRGDLLFNRTNSREKVGKTCVVDTDQPLAFAGYAEPACVRAMFTFHALDRAKAAYTAVSTSRKLCLMRHADSGEYLQAPVVIAGEQHWSGFRPDAIKSLSNQAVFTSRAMAVNS